MAQHRYVLSNDGHVEPRYRIAASFSPKADSERAKGRNRLTLQTLNLTRLKLLQQYNTAVPRKPIVDERRDNRARACPSGFVVKPATVLFRDFDVGMTYRCGVLLTNASDVFNNFKVLPLCKDVVHILAVKWEPTHMLASGLSASLEVIFTPTKEADVDTCITISSMLGEENLTVKCRRKVTAIEVSARNIDFGRVIVAERATRIVTLKNTGAKATTFSVHGDILSSTSLRHNTADGGTARVLTTIPELTQDYEGTLHAFSSFTISLCFSPLEICTLSSHIAVSFVDSEVDDVIVVVKGAAVSLPVTLSPALLSFGCCYYNVLYRDRFQCHNSGATSVKVAPQVQSTLRDVVEFVPKFGFVQPGGGTLEIQVKLTPQPYLLDELDITIPIKVSEQTMPLSVRIKATLSRHAVFVDPMHLHVGLLSMGELFQQPLSVKNDSKLIRKIGFVRVPKNIVVSPLHVCEVAPGETTQFTVGVSPMTIGQFTQALSILTNDGTRVSVQVTGHGRAPTVSCNPCEVSLPVAYIGTSVSAVVDMVNHTNIPQHYWTTPTKLYGLTIAPASATIPPAGHKSVVVTFTPTAELLQSKDNVADRVTDETDVEKATAMERKRQEKESGGGRSKRKKGDGLSKAAERYPRPPEEPPMHPWVVSTDGEPWSLHRRVIVPFHLDGARATYGAVGCCVAKPTVTISTEEKGAPNPAVAQAVVDFGRVPANHTATAAVRIVNVDAMPVNIAAQPLDPHGVFFLIQAPSPRLLPGQSTRATIRFRPKSSATYQQDVVFVAQGANTVTARLQGSGLPAMLNIDGPLVHAGGTIDFGSCAIHEKRDVAVTFHNPSPFPLVIDAAFDPAQLLNFNLNGTIPFSLNPHRFVIPAEKSTAVSATFSPNAEGAYRAIAAVRYGGNSSRTLVLHGYCCEKGIHVVLPKTDDRRRDAFSSFGELSAVDGTNPRQPLELKLHSGGEPVDQMIQLCNTRPQPAECVVEGLTDADLRNGWRMEPLKCSVPHHARTWMTITWTPSEGLRQSLPVPGVSIVSSANVRLVLRGGGFPTEGPIHLHLRGTVVL